jgi:DNA-binding Lrp family transcriptional regulator
MSYCHEIKALIEGAEVIRITTQLYLGDERASKYRVVAAANHFIKKKVDLASFNKNRCKPNFTGQEISDLTEQVNGYITTLNEAQRLHIVISSQTGVPPINEADAIAFLSDNPMVAIRDQYYRLHYGDDDALSTVLWGYCIKWVEVAYDEGVHIIAIGLRGSGKSHGITSAMTFLPQELAWIKGITARYLYYAKDLVRGLTIYLDELPSNPDMIDSLKAIITSYPNGGKRGTIVNGEAVEQSLPARITINTSSVDQKADEQFVNRMTTIRSSVDKVNREKRVGFRLELYEGKKEQPDKEIVSRIHNALRYISTRNFTVVVPGGAIGCNNAAAIDVRVLNQFMCAVMGNAILNFPNRNPTTNGSDIHIMVTKEDFDAVIHLYQKPDEYLLKLTSSGISIKNYLEHNFPDHKSIGQIAKVVGLDPETVRTTIKGRKDRNSVSLIDAGYVEEIGITSQEVEVIIKGSGIYEHEATKHVGERIVAKAYRSTQSSAKSVSDDLYTTKKKPEFIQTEMSDIVGMVYWKDSISSNPNPTNPTASNQCNAGSFSSLTTTLSNQSNQVQEGGD